MQSFKNYHDAFNAAVKLARELNRETGLLAAKEYSAQVFQVFSLPKPENRYGFELRCQVVSPTEPMMGALS